MKAHYEIDHYPNFATHLFAVCADEPGRKLITQNMSLADARAYVVESYEGRGQTARLTETREDGALLIRSQEIEIP